MIRPPKWTGDAAPIELRSEGENQIVFCAKIALDRDCQGMTYAVVVTFGFPGLDIQIKIKKAKE